ncbi:Hypothetical_protein [Hexamita inflata]|uniref:Hypothetical_protein n=1 Tax=Hexamita inflata TaxID=28002 RepID=A0AA86N5H7_9EUKA|nr:Hypothetical protein HINF_LOCUS770 [Hexamita inflata]
MTNLLKYSQLSVISTLSYEQIQMYCNLQNNFDNYEMISASKRKSVLKLTINQYNTVKSGIALGQRILPNLHSFQLEKQICLEIRRSAAIRTKSLPLAQVAPNLDHHRKVLVYVVQSSGAQMEHKITKCWESTLSVSCKANFRSRSFFQVQVAI